MPVSPPPIPASLRRNIQTHGHPRPRPLGHAPRADRPSGVRARTARLETKDFWDLPAGLSRYQPFAQIGRGGMAEVILAGMYLGPGIEKLAVLKRVWPDLASDPDFVSMFLEEGRIGACMNHPNVIQTYELVADPERPLIAMEYLDGQPLARVLSRLADTNTLTLDLRLRIVGHVLAALDYAHELTDYDGTPQGVVHQDVNPQNVFLTYSGDVKLVDFGLAKSLTAAYQTRPGLLRGKLAYMAPEQLLGGVVDRRADIFAAGVMLWELAAGRRLWQGMTEGAIIRQLTSRIPAPPLGSNSRLPAGLEKICARALARDPANRYATAAEFEADIHRLLARDDDRQGRQLGKVVSLAFVEERKTRRALIEAHLPLLRPRARAADDAVQLEDDSETIRSSWDVGAPESFEELPAETSPPAAIAPPAVMAPRVIIPPPPAAPVAREGVRATHLVVPRPASGRLRWTAVGFAAALAFVLLVMAAGPVRKLLPGLGRSTAALGLTAPATAPPASAPPAPPAPPPTLGHAVTVPLAKSTSPAAPVSTEAPSDRWKEPSELPAVADAPPRKRRHRASYDDVPELEEQRETAFTPSADDILEPTVDLSDAESPGGTAAERLAASAPPAKHSRRLGARPIDTADPFQP